MLLNIDGVTAGYGKNQVLHELSLHMEKGEITALVGPNGAGKTTTLRCIAGIVRPSRGTVIFDGQDVSRVPTHGIIGRGISYCPEGRDMFGNLTVFENLKMGGYLVSSRREFLRQLQWIYELFPQLNERRSQLSASLSGGEQQMLAIARALMGRPELLLLDEPSMGLAPVIVREVFSGSKCSRTKVYAPLLNRNAPCPRT